VQWYRYDNSIFFLYCMGNFFCHFLDELVEIIRESMNEFVFDELYGLLYDRILVRCDIEI
jgi:hypothetical protein